MLTLALVAALAAEPTPDAPSTLTGMHAWHIGGGVAAASSVVVPTVFYVRALRTKDERFFRVGSLIAGGTALGTGVAGVVGSALASDVLGPRMPVLGVASIGLGAMSMALAGTGSLASPLLAWGGTACGLAQIALTGHAVGAHRARRVEVAYARTERGTSLLTLSGRF
ncbi:MAG: hypothetical protein EP330_26905 [Deltaproteobacteria bacterium]|nr:MAG: hypothetical protein EP330_26905 [Deltaproteobacteria bacterium]